MIESDAVEVLEVAGSVWVGWKAFKNARTGDYAWMVIAIAVIIYELVADDLLSEATERYCGAHPVLTRMGILAIAGHLAVMLPPWIDIFDARNVLHRGFVAASRLDRSKRGS